MSLDLTKPVALRTGQRVQILTVALEPLYNGDTIIGVTTETRQLVSWQSDGTFDKKRGPGGDMDLVNA